MHRPVLAITLGSATAFTVGYIGGYILNLALLWAMIAGASTFMQFVIMLIGMFAVIGTGYRAGSLVTAYIASGKFDRHFEAMKAKMTPAPVVIVDEAASA